MAIADRMAILDAGAVGQLAQPRRAQSLCLSKTCGPDPTRTPNCQYMAALVGTSPSTLRYSCRATNGKWVRPSWTTRWFPQAFKGVMEQLQYAVKMGSETELNASDNRNCSGRRLRFQAAQGRGRPSRVRRMASMARIDLRRAVSTTDRISA